MIEIWYAPGTVALAALIALEEAGAEYRAHRLAMAQGAQRGADYLALNPKGRVPTLKTEEGVLTETPAILSWVAASYPAAGLMPADPFRAGKVQELCAYLCSTAHVSHAHGRRGARWSDDPAVIEGLKAKVGPNMAEHFTYLSDQIGAPWAMGDEYTVADPYLFTVARWLPGDGVPLEGLPRIAAHVERMQARPAVQRALAVMA